MLSGSLELCRREGRHERERIDLAVRMVQRDADLLALVLKDVNVGHLGA